MLFILLVGLCYVGVEGFASTLVAITNARDGVSGPALRRYDPLLGWVSLPSLRVEDVWGRGRSLRTNSRGFRGSREISGAPAAGRIRAVCSGDSFTFGQGVGDENTWCERLSRLDARIETVNLGEPGYGVDQSFLRYRRDAEGLPHDLHLFAFIGYDLERVAYPRNHGYGKPQLRIEGEELVVTNVPVPRVVPALRRFVRRTAEDLRAVELGRRLFATIDLEPLPYRPPEIDRLGPLVQRVFREVAELSTSRGSTIVFVYLPDEAELEDDGRWREWTRNVFATLKYPLIDLTDSLRSVSPEEAVGYFIPPGAEAQYHYSEAGNAWAARAIHSALLALGPEIVPIVPSTQREVPSDQGPG